MTDITCRVSADLDRHLSEQERNTPSDAEIASARREIIEEVLAGERVGKMLDLAVIIEAEINDNYARTIRSLYEHFAGIDHLDDIDRLLRCDAANDWMTRLVEAAVTEDCDEVHDRAIAYRADSDERRGEE